MYITYYDSRIRSINQKTLKTPSVVVVEVSKNPSSKLRFSNNFTKECTASHYLISTFKHLKIFGVLG